MDALAFLFLGNVMEKQENRIARAIYIDIHQGLLEFQPPSLVFICQRSINVNRMFT